MMTVTDVLQEIKKLSDADKLLLAQATIQMVQESLQQPLQFSMEEASSEIDLDDYFSKDTRNAFLEEMQAFLQMPDPDVEHILKAGTFKGRVPTDDEAFQVAEWRLSEDEINF
jgi:hypothetical protein